MQEGLSSILKNLDSQNLAKVQNATLNKPYNIYKQSSKAERSEANSDFLKTMGQKGKSYNNQNHHMNRSYLGIKNSQGVQNYKAIVKSNEMMKQE